jgi:hypothetical protein
MDGHDSNFARIDPLHHVESLASVGDRVARKKDQEKKKQQKKQHSSKEPDTFEEQDDQHDTDENKEGHIDFRA